MARISASMDGRQQVKNDSSGMALLIVCFFLCFTGDTAPHSPPVACQSSGSNSRFGKLLGQTRHFEPNLGREPAINSHLHAKKGHNSGDIPHDTFKTGIADVKWFSRFRFLDTVHRRGTIFI